MRAGLRQTDLVGRLGGEEFTVVLADASMDNAYLVADRLRRSFAANAAVIDNEAVHATASIGVSVIVDPRQDLAKLITLADQALYLAKARGRNRVEVAPIEVAEEREAGAPAATAERGLITPARGRRPHLCGRRRHVDVHAASFGNGIRDRVHDRRDRAGGAGLAHALHAERIGGRRHVVARVRDRRHVRGARHRVVHERAGDELPVALVVDGGLHQRLPDPLREPADQLALDQRVIEHDAGIVHRRIG